MRFALLTLMTIFTLPSLAFAQGGDVVTIIEMPDDSKVFDALNNKNDNLYVALEAAYNNNPTVRAARAELLAVEEQLDLAKAGFRPNITADADVTYVDTETEGTSFILSDGGNTSKNAALNLNQPLYRGGQTLAEVNGARNIIAAQEFNLSGVEQSVLYNATVAYMNVLQNESILALNFNNRDLVTKEREQAQNRFTVGELTRTDVSQAEARLANADAQVITARGNLIRSRAVYGQIVGAPPPKSFAYPLTILELPLSLEEALSVADTNNRTVLQSKFIKQAAEYDVDSSRGAMLPLVSAVGRAAKSYNPSDFIDEQSQLSFGISASVPLYQAGTNLARVRQAQKTVNQRAIQIIEARELARQETIDAWESLETAQANVGAREAQIKAARIAREGVHYEAKVGERTTLDALDANQELLDARVALISAKRNEVVARFALARSLGLLVPQKLGFTSITR